MVSRSSSQTTNMIRFQICESDYMETDNIIHSSLPIPSRRTLTAQELKETNSREFSIAFLRCLDQHVSVRERAIFRREREEKKSHEVIYLSEAEKLTEHHESRMLSDLHSAKEKADI